jgi:uncharacterized membrane protein
MHVNDLVNNFINEGFFTLSKEEISQIELNIKEIEKNAKTELKDFKDRSVNINNENDKKILKKDIEESIKKLESIKNDKQTNIVLSSLKIIGGAIIIIPGAIVGPAFFIVGMLSAIPIILSGIVIALAGATVAFGTKLIKQSDFEGKTCAEVLDIQIQANKKILKSLD